MIDRRCSRGGDLSACDVDSVAALASRAVACDSKGVLSRQRSRSIDRCRSEDGYRRCSSMSVDLGIFLYRQAAGIDLEVLRIASSYVYRSVLDRDICSVDRDGRSVCRDLVSAKIQSELRSFGYCVSAKDTCFRYVFEEFDLLALGSLHCIDRCRKRYVSDSVDLGYRILDRYGLRAFSALVSSCDRDLACLAEFDLAGLIDCRDCLVAGRPCDRLALFRSLAVDRRSKLLASASRVASRRYARYCDSDLDSIDDIHVVIFRSDRRLSFDDEIVGDLVAVSSTRDESFERFISVTVSICSYGVSVLTDELAAGYLDYGLSARIAAVVDDEGFARSVASVVPVLVIFLFAVTGQGAAGDIQLTGLLVDSSRTSDGSTVDRRLCISCEIHCDIVGFDICILADDDLRARIRARLAAVDSQSKVSGLDRAVDRNSTILDVAVDEYSCLRCNDGYILADRQVSSFCTGYAEHTKLTVNGCDRSFACNSKFSTAR